MKVTETERSILDRMQKARDANAGRIGAAVIEHNYVVARLTEEIAANDIEARRVGEEMCRKYGVDPDGADTVRINVQTGIIEKLSGGAWQPVEAPEK